MSIKYLISKFKLSFLLLIPATLIVFSACEAEEIIKEVVKEVPVEKIVTEEVIKEVIKEVPKETIVEVTKEVIKEVPKEKIVEKIVKEVEIREVPAGIPSASYQSVLRIGNGGEVQFLDAAKSQSGTDIIFSELLYSRLLQYDPSMMNPKPDIAESWTVSPDGKTYVCLLYTSPSPRD